MASETLTQKPEKRQSPKRKLNTKGCCFLCLTIVDFKIETENVIEENTPQTNTRNNNITFNHLQRYLNIMTATFLNKDNIDTGSNSNATNKKHESQVEQIEVDLCKSCSGIITRFSTLFLSFEAIQMEMRFWLGRLHHLISKAFMKPEVVQNYLKRMTSNLDASTQLTFVDKLRKEISKKSEGQSRATLEAKVALHPIENLEQYLRNASVLFANESYEDDPLEEAFQLDSSSHREIESTIEKTFKAEIVQESVSGDNGVDEPSAAPSDDNTASCGNKNKKGEMFPCRICGKEFLRKCLAYKHFKEIHAPKPFVCDLCGHRYHAKYKLKAHRSKCDGVLRDWKKGAPAKTDYRIIKSTELKPALNIEDNLTSSSGKSKPETSLLLEYKNQFVAKNKTHSKESNEKILIVKNPKAGSFQCYLCKKTFTNARRARLHYEAIHLQKRYNCDNCGAAYSRLDNVRRHKKTCTGNKPRPIA